MIEMDFNKIMISNIMANLLGKAYTKDEIEENLVRHMILNSLRGLKGKFSEYGDVVVAYDSGPSWRKQVFPYYKANRKKAQEASVIDWHKLFEFLNKIKAELKVVLPYKVIEVANAEADDIIGHLAKLVGNYEPVMIISGDKDFIQLHGKNVKQYDPVRKRDIKNPDGALAYLQRHILAGDSGDGIPNVLSDDDAFVNPDKRQKPLTKKKYKLLIDNNGNINEQVNRNCARNKQLIDLTFTPENIKIKIKEEFEAEHTRDRQILLKYLMKNDCRYLVENIGDF